MVSGFRDCKLKYGKWPSRNKNVIIYEITYGMMVLFYIARDEIRVSEGI